MKNFKRLYSLREAAFYLGQGVHTLRDRVHRGEIPIVKSGRTMYVDITDLEQFVERNKVVLND